MSGKRACSLLLVAWPALMCAQAGVPASPAAQAAYRLQVDAEEVLLHATVVAARNLPVPELSREQFRVYDNGALQVIRSFHRERAPVSLGILIDRSDSMRKQHQHVRTSALAFINAGTPHDERFLAGFAYAYSLQQGFTVERARLAAALEQMQSRGGTALYDAVAESAAYLMENARHPRRVLVVISDGVDVHSRLSLEDTLRRLQGEGAPEVYVIAMLGADSDAQRGRAELQRLAAETGGRALFPRSARELARGAQALARALGERYVITYRPHPTGGYHAVRVEATAGAHPQLEVRTRAGYVAGPR